MKIKLLLVLSSFSRFVHCPVLPETVSKSSAAADTALFSGIPDDALGSKKEFEGSMGAGSGGEWWWASRKGSSAPPRQSSTMQSIIGFEVRNEQKISRRLHSEITEKPQFVAKKVTSERNRPLESRHCKPKSKNSPDFQAVGFLVQNREG